MTLLAVAALPSLARAQHDDPASAGVHESMGGGMPATSMAAHLKMTPRRAPSPGDSARAARTAAALRGALEKYRDVRAAARDGFTMFLPNVKDQRVYHFTSNRRALAAAFRFDPAEPTSLLYTKDAAGRFVLLGAMYTAPRHASLEELDARVPLSVARWHAHVDICVPRRGESERWRETEGGRMRFGPAGAIATRAACDAAGGRFFPQLFSWMVHASVFAGDGRSDDPSTVWGQH